MMLYFIIQSNREKNLNTVTVQKENTILHNNVEYDIVRKHRPFKLSFREMSTKMLKDGTMHSYVKITDKIETGRIYSCIFSNDFQHLLACETV